MNFIDHEHGYKMNFIVYEIIYKYESHELYDYE